MPPRKPMRGSQERLPGDPTDEEIRSLCADIRATWTQAEERKRRVGFAGFPEFTVPESKHRPDAFNSMDFD